MIYKVFLDDISIYESDGNVIILEPTLNQEINTAGSFEFTMPRTHINYDSPTLLSSEVEVYEGDTNIFFGRITEVEIDIDLQKKIYCEGALAYLSDSVLPPFTHTEIDRIDFFEYLIEQHNARVPDKRKFTVGNVIFSEKTLYRKSEEYKTTLECINEYLLNTEGGYLMVRKENGVRYIDWYESLPYSNTQPVRFSLNLISLSQKINSDFFTSIIPIGDSGLTIASVNGGRVYLDSDYISQYGRITGVVKFDGVTNATLLMAYGMKYIEDQRYGSATINVVAAELHYINNEYSPFLIGQKVTVVSVPHKLEAVLPIVKLTLNLDNAGKEIEIGTLDRKTLTELVKDSEGKMVSSSTSVEVDPTPTYGSNKAVSSSGVFEALGPLRFVVNNDGTVTVREVSSED